MASKGGLVVEGRLVCVCVCVCLSLRCAGCSRRSIQSGSSPEQGL